MDWLKERKEIRLNLIRRTKTRDRLPPVVLGPNILSKGVKTGPTATQFSPACAQTMPCLPGAHLQ